jgi:Mrp family chromosome partitioning ATPase
MAASVRDEGQAGPRLQAEVLTRYARIIREHIWLVISCVVLATGAGIAYVKTATKEYTATSQMLVTPAPVDNSNLIGLPILHSSGDPTRDVLTAATLITTNQVTSAVLKSLHLHKSVNQLLGDVHATPVGQSNLVSVQARSSSPSQAQAIANAFAHQVVATRTAALHAAVSSILPGVRAQVASLPPGQRGGPGTPGDQLAQLRQLRSSNDPTISIAALADRPTSPTFPKTKLTVAATLLAGLLLGLSAALGFDLLDPRLRREEQLRELFGLPILARIPEERKHARGRPIRPDEISLGVAEGYRTLRTVLASRAAGESRSFLVTGSSPNEGKTTSAINLCTALAQGGSRVILIEADLRRPKIASTLGLVPEAGVEDVLAGHATLEDALLPAALDDVEANVLAVKQPGVDKANLLSPDASWYLVKKAMELADYVVIDSPPLTAVVDALPLAQLVDEVLVVARLGTSRLGRLSDLHELLLDEGSYPTGIVIIGKTTQGYDYYGAHVMNLRVAETTEEPETERAFSD